MPNKLRKSRQRRLRHLHQHRPPSSSHEEAVQIPTDAESTLLEPNAASYGDQTECEGLLLSAAKPSRSPVLPRLASIADRRACPSTPVPTWKMYDHISGGSMSDHRRNHSISPSDLGTGCSKFRGQRFHVSARKLAAALWELEGMESFSATVVNQRASKSDDVLETPASSRDHISASSKFSPEIGVVPTVASADSQAADTGTLLSSLKNAPLSEHDLRQLVETGPVISSNLITVLHQICSLEEQHCLNTSMIASLQSDLKNARARVRELTTKQKLYEESLDKLQKEVADERAMLQERVEEAIIAAIEPLRNELKRERKTRQKLESSQRKMIKKVTEARKALMKTRRELEKEQKARELIEDVCDELAREIGNDKAQVEELKQQSAKVIEEVEEERKMLQMADALREERVYMKLAEARHELEEKNSTLDQLRKELENFLRVKRSLTEQTSVTGTSFDQSTYTHNLDHKQKRKQHSESNLDDIVEEKDTSCVREELNITASSEGCVHDLSSNDYSLTCPDGTHSEVAENNKKLFGGCISLGKGITKTRQEKVLRSGLQRSRSGPVGVGAIRDGSSDFQKSCSHRIDGQNENNLSRDTSSGTRIIGTLKEKSCRSRKTDNEDSQSHSEISKGKSSAVHINESFRNLLREQTCGGIVSYIYLCDDGLPSTLEPSATRDKVVNVTSVSEHANNSSFFLSPTGRWNQHCFSVCDEASTSRSNQILVEIQRDVNNDNSLKAKLLEAKLEVQQARMRNSTSEI